MDSHLKELLQSGGETQEVRGADQALKILLESLQPLRHELGVKSAARVSRIVALTAVSLTY